MAHRSKRYAYLQALLLIATVSGVTSRILSIDMLVEDRFLSSDIYKSISFVAESISPNETVLTVSDYDSRRLMILSGLSEGQTIGRLENAHAYFQLLRPDAGAFYALDQSRIRYLFLTRQDLNELRYMFVAPMLEYLPLAYNDSLVSVYENPGVVPPSLGSRLAIVRPEQFRPAYSEKFRNESIPENWEISTGSWEISNESLSGTDGEIILRSTRLLGSPGVENFSLRFKLTVGKFGVEDYHCPSILFGIAENSSAYYRLDLRRSGIYLWYSPDGASLVEIGANVRISIGFLEGITYSVRIDVRKMLRGQNILIYINDEVAFASQSPMQYSGDIVFRSPQCQILLSDVQLLVISSPIISYFLPLYALSLSDLNYTIVSEKDRMLDYSHILLGSDPFISDVHVSSYMDWVENGGFLFVMNSYGERFFGNFLSLTRNDSEVKIDGIRWKGASQPIVESYITPVYSSDENVTVLSHYTFGGNIVTPYAFRKNVGKGAIIYLNVQTLYYDYLGSIPPMRREILNSFRVLTKGLFQQRVDKKLVREVRFGAPLDYFLGSANASGSITVKTQSFVLPAELDVSSLSVTRSGEDHSYFQYNGRIRVEDLSGAMSLTIQSTQMRIGGETDAPTYVRLRFPDTVHVKLTGSDGSHARFTLVENGNLSSPDNGSWSIDFHLKGPRELLVKQPAVNIHGTTAFSKLAYPSYYFETGSYVDDPLTPMTSIIQGSLNFTIPISQDTVCVLMNSKFSGGMTVENPVFVARRPFSGLENRTVPNWFAIAISVPNIVLNVCTVLFVIVISRKKWSVLSY